MELLKNKIIETSEVKDGNIIKVDSFLNHQVDINLLNNIGEEFKKRFENFKVDKILTAAVSGIAVGTIVAQHFKVPLLFARKDDSQNLSDDTYTSEVYSYTGEKNYNIKVSKKFLRKNENILIIDDFLANGQAVSGLIDLVEKAEANLIGVGVVIEKGFQFGGKAIRDEGIRLESLVIVESIENNKIIFK